MSFTFIDLFAGIGGIRIPFDELGGKCVFTSEWDKFAQQTYQANFGERPHGDITQIKPSEIPSFDLLLAGFPCQPFSHAGLKKGFNDTRGTLFYDIVKIIQHHKPKAVFLENVKGLVGHDKGRTFATIKNVLEEELGYHLYYKIHSAKDFGVPQNRQRIFIVALRDEFDFEFAEPSGIPTRVGDILEKNVDDKYTISDKLWEGAKRRKEEHKAKGNGFGYSVVNADSPYANTISARYYKDGSEIWIEQKGKNPRKLTPREAARLQGFPENFKIPVSDGQAYKQFGNAVAVPAIRSVAKQLAPYLNVQPARLENKEYEFVPKEVNVQVGLLPEAA
jgi:DNA (cytosine-5)-methyltransferase 1